ncbi:putative transcriptional regulator [Deinococcus sp. HSC-46F16]|uniref:ArsR/SmtB family transcription factor n=1 Tax=Deinococcus sp. HSC-46F16 TaxID=2910968 RepID=UPI0020A09C55|nr:putative transcriptional regulator [Deinococcus sp. HSC-46F16]
MKSSSASSPDGDFFEVADPAAIALLLRERPRRVLAAFLSGETTVSAAARQTGLDLRVVHRDVQALARAGLLRVSRLERRAGRAVKHYRPSADAYFVDHLNTPAADLGELTGASAARTYHLFHHAADREFSRALRESGRRWGWWLYATPEPPGYHMDQGSPADRRVSALQEWQGPAALMLQGFPVFRLTDEQARELQRDLILLMRKGEAYEEANAGGGRSFLLPLGIAPLTEEEAAGLHR